MKFNIDFNSNKTERNNINLINNNNKYNKFNKDLNSNKTKRNNNSIDNLNKYKYVNNNKIGINNK